MLLFEPERVLDLLGIGIRNPFVHFVGFLLLVKVWLLLTLVGYVVYKRSRRLYSRHNNEARYLNHLREIFTYVQGKGSEEVKLKLRDRYFFRRLLLAQMGVMEGADQHYLRRLYRELGFFDEDLKALRSRFWWKRLAAVTRLEACKFQEAFDPISRLVEDQSDFVAMVAMRALSGIEYPHKIEIVLDALSRRAPARRDIFAEILTNFGENHLDEIIAYLDHCFDPHIAAICLDVLGQFQSERALLTIERFAQSSDDQVVEAVARALGEYKEGQGLHILRKLWDHPSDKVRAAAIRSSAQLKDNFLNWTFWKFKEDPSVIVKRTLFEVYGERAL